MARGNEQLFLYTLVTLHSEWNNASIAYNYNTNKKSTFPKLLIVIFYVENIRPFTVILYYIIFIANNICPSHLQKSHPTLFFCFTKKKQNFKIIILLGITLITYYLYYPLFTPCIKKMPDLLKSSIRYTQKYWTLFAFPYGNKCNKMQ